MPQIANQDYNVIKSNGAAYDTNPEIYARLAGHLERGTIFDVVAELYPHNFCRVLGVFQGNNGTPRVTYIHSEDGSTGQIELPYTPEQYFGLAAVKSACNDDDFPAVCDYEESGYLGEYNTGVYLCADGKFVSVEYGQDKKITALIMADDAPVNEDFVNMSFDDLQKLIGVVLYSG